MVIAAEYNTDADAVQYLRYDYAIFYAFSGASALLILY